MENNVLIIFFGFILVIVIGYLITVYNTSHIYKERDIPVPTPRPTPLPKPKACNPKDLTELKEHIKDALLSLRYNMRTIKSEKITGMRPEVLLSIYPFYTNVLKLPQYMKKNNCYGRKEVFEAMKQLYGPNPEKSHMLHVKRPLHSDYYIVIDMFDAIAYYEKYYDEGIDDII